MNQENELSADRPHEPELAGQRERLGEIERRLKKARPRPPRLDAAALEALARAAPVDAAGGPTAGKTGRRARARARRSYRGMAVVAGSWACGAVAGALAMFLLTGPGRSASDLPGQTVHYSIEMPPAASEPEALTDFARESERDDTPLRPAPVKQPGPFDEKAAQLAMIIDSLGSGRSAPWPDGPTLRVGTHLGRLAGEPSDVLPPATIPSRQRWPEEQAVRARGSMRTKEDLAPPAVITRERLMEDLLREMSGLVL